MQNQNYRLSYPIETVYWNGSVIFRVSEEKYFQKLNLLKSLGITEVMISGYGDHEPAEFDMMEETKRIGCLFRSMGMKAAQHHGLCPMYAPIGTSQDSAVEMLKRQVDYAVNLNADVAMFHPGWCTEWKKSSNIWQFEDAVEKHGLDALIEVCANNLRIAGEYAQPKGIKIAFENVDRFEPMANIEILPRLVEKTDSPAVGFCLDSGHAHCCCNNVLKWIEVMGAKLFTTHFHDNRGMRLDALTDKKWIKSSLIDEHLPPGFGTIPWIDVIQALRKHSYTDTVTFESGGWPGMDEKEGYLAAIRFWRTCEHLAKAKNG
jgi:sugar phosphate isomerase/epimerase